MLNFDKEVVPDIGCIGIDVNIVQCLQQKVVICSKVVLAKSMKLWMVLEDILEESL